MITLRKLETLAERTRARKLMTLLAAAHDPSFTAGLVRLSWQILGQTPFDQSPILNERERSALRQRLALWLGVQVADWDFQTPHDRTGPVIQFPFHVWLDDVRSPFNVGSIIRTAEAYGFAGVFHSPLTPGLGHSRTQRSAMGAEQHLPVQTLSLDDLQSFWGQRPVLALELGGTAVESFDFPKEGLVLLGGEELGLSPEALQWADQSLGRVSLPLYGRKASLNVGVAFGVLAATWTDHVLNRQL